MPVRRDLIATFQQKRARALAAGHTVRAETVEDAACAFVDRWHPPADASGDVVLMITDCETLRDLR